MIGLAKTTANFLVKCLICEKDKCCLPLIERVQLPIPSYPIKKTLFRKLWIEIMIHINISV